MLEARDVVRQVKYQRFLTAQQGAKDVLYGYGVCEKNTTLDEVGRAILWLNNKESCLCPEERQRIHDLYIAEHGPECKDVPLDYTEEVNTQWILHNPECVRYTHWLDALKAECALIGLNLQALPHRCDAVDVNLRTQERICEIVDVGLKIKEHLCDVSLNLSAEQINECKVDFALKIVPLNCGVDFATVLKAVKCGATVDLVAEALQCGYTLKPGSRGVDFCFQDTEIDLE